MAGAGVVPGVGAFRGHLVQALDDVDGPVRLQLVEVGAEAGAHDAGADQHHVDRLLRLLVLGAAEHTEAEES
ncbi:hypothetical protein D3C76_1817590 [compost metagenome]